MIMKCQNKKNGKLNVDYLLKKGQGLANSRF